MVAIWLDHADWPLVIAAVRIAAEKAAKEHYAAKREEGEPDKPFTVRIAEALAAGQSLHTIADRIKEQLPAE